MNRQGSLYLFIETNLTVERTSMIFEHFLPFLSEARFNSKIPGMSGKFLTYCNSDIAGICCFCSDSLCSFLLVYLVLVLDCCFVLLIERSFVVKNCGNVV